MGLGFASKSAGPHLTSSKRYVFNVPVSSHQVRKTAAELIAAVRGREHADAFLRPTLAMWHVTEIGDARALVNYLEQVVRDMPCGFDFETSGWAPKAEVLGMFGPATSTNIHPMTPSARPVPETFQICWGQDSYIVEGKFLHLFVHWLCELSSIDVANQSFEYTVMRAAGVHLNRFGRDLIQMDYLLDETSRQWAHDLKTVANDRLGVEPRSYDKVFGSRSYRSVITTNPESGLEYAGFDPWMTVFGCDVLQAMLVARPARPGYDSMELYQHWERPYSMALTRMQCVGVPINAGWAWELGHKTQQKLAAIETEAYKAAGRVVDIGSLPDLRRYFFKEKRRTIAETSDGQHCLLCQKDVTSRTNGLCMVHGAGALVNNPKCDKNILDEMAATGEPFAVKVTERRKVLKQLSTWIDPMLRYAELFDGTQGLVGFPSLNGAHVVSGRLGGGVWLTIPRDKDFRKLIGLWDGVGPQALFDFLSQKLGREVTSEDCEVPDEEFLTADYSQLELRLLAHASQDPVLLDAFAKGRDMHAWTAALVVAYQRYGDAAVTDESLRVQVYDEIIAAKTKDEEGDILAPSEFDLVEHRQKRGKCFHPETEFLTRRGWMVDTDILPDDEVIQAVPTPGGVLLEWVKPTEVVRLKHPSEKLVMLESRAFRLGVTPDHRIAVVGGPAGYTVIEAEKVHGGHQVPASGHLLAGPETVDEVLLRIAVAAQADATYSAQTVTWGFKKQRKIERLTALLDQAGLSYESKPTKGGEETTIVLYGGGAREVQHLLDWPRKVLPWSWLNLSYSQRRVVIDEFRHWDCETTSAGPRYTTKIKQNADVLQAIAASIGLKTWLAPDRVWWRLTVYDDPANKTHIDLKSETVAWTDEVACISVPSTFVLTRFHGSVQVVGQTINFALVYGAGDEKLAEGMEVSVEEARKIISIVRSAYAGVEAWKAANIKAIEESGYLLRTLLGRGRLILELASTDPGKRAEGERLATNQVCQAGGGDVIRGAMIQWDMDLERGGCYGTTGRGAYGHWVQTDGEPIYVLDPDRIPKSWSKKLPPALELDFGALGRMNVRQLLQVHDELASRAKKAIREAAQKRIKAIMSDPFGDDLKITCPLKVSVGQGQTWAEAK